MIIDEVIYKWTLELRPKGVKQVCELLEKHYKNEIVQDLEQAGCIGYTNSNNANSNLIYSIKTNNFNTAFFVVYSKGISFI